MEYLSLFLYFSKDFYTFYHIFLVILKSYGIFKISEYDQEIPQSQTADNPVAPRGRAAQPINFYTFQRIFILFTIVIFSHFEIL